MAPEPIRLKNVLPLAEAGSVVCTGLQNTVGGRGRGIGRGVCKGTEP